MATDDGFSTDMTEVLAEALLDNLRQKPTSEVARFLQTFSEDARRHLFRFTEGNENRHSFPYPFLQVACQYAKIDAVLMLLSYGADPSLRTEKEGTALEVASRHGRLDMIKKLIEWEPKLIEDRDIVKDLLAIACFAGHQDITEFWLTKLKAMKNGEAICKDDFVGTNDPLIAACRGEHYGLAIHLLETQVTVITRETALRTGLKFNPILQMWCEKETDETQENERCDAKWSGRHLHYFDAAWLTRNPDLKRTLVRINLSHNALSSIPAVLLWELPCLESLDVSHNNLAELPGPETLEVLKETRLTNLKVSHNILQFPVLEIFMHPVLETLDLSHNKITSLNHKRFPSELVLPAEDEKVWKCSNLMSLNVSSNSILRIPQYINAAKNLKKLNVSHNRLNKLPAPWDCPLATFNAAHNFITDVPDMHGYWSRSLTNLDFSYNMLPEIPWTICQLTALNCLKLTNNHISKLPDPESWSIYSLRDLILSCNRLVFVENTAPASPKRKSSNLSAKLNFKRDSGVSSTTFYSDSSSAGSDSATTIVFPECFSDCLMTLDLKNNRLRDVPPSLSNLSYLQKLDLSGNTGIEKLPDTMAKLKNLYSLNLSGLKIKEPASVVSIMQEKEHKTRKILEKLNERFLKCSPYRGMKLMLVGPEKCGKTSVLSCLTKREPDDDLGVNICSWTLQDPARLVVKPSLKKKLFHPKPDQSTSGQNDVHFSAWDLKGGEMNSIIHQSFFTARALYLLVWDLRDRLDGVEKLRPWLLNIQSRAPESAIIIVSTHLDKGRKSQSLDSIREEIRSKYSCRDGFPDIAEIVEVTGTTPEGEGIKELRHAIYKTALGMRIKKRWGSGAVTSTSLIGQMIPRTFTILQEIIASGADRCKRSIPPLPPIMKDAELTSHIKKIPDNKIETGQDIEEAAEFLSISGTLVHFSDHLQGLTSLYFLDPVWLYDILSNVANINSSYVKEGRIHRSSLEEQFKKSGFGEGRFEEYQQLLQRLEIVLPISRIEYLIPSRLPKEKPGQDFSPVLEDGGNTFQVLERLYKLPYTPPGFWSRLVSRVYVFLKFLGENGGRKVKAIAKRDLRRGVQIKRSSRLRQSMRVGLKLSRTNIMYWQQGVSVQHNTGQILLKPITFLGDKPGICVRISCHIGEFQPMGFMVDQIENLIKEWYPGLLGVDEFTGKPLIERLVPCPVCRKLSVQTERPLAMTHNLESDEVCHHFSVSKLALSATMKGMEHAECPRHQEGLKLRKLIPDLYLIDLPVGMLNKKDFDFDPRVSPSLGSGGYGEVFKAQFRREDVAVKMLIKSTFFNSRTDSGLHSSADEDSKKSSAGSDRSDSGKQSVSPKSYDENNADVNAIFVMEGFSNLRGEVATMSKLRHPCIIHLIGISIQHLCFAMELAPLGDLASLLKREMEAQRGFFTINSKIYRTILDRVLTFKIAMQIARGVSYLHKQRVIYSDLKTDNVLLYSMDVEAPVNIKLTDYGIARSMDLQGARGQAGPTGFCAPEIQRGRTFTEKVDWFSYGMLIYHLMSGAWPYDNLKSAVEVRNAVNMGIKPGFQFRDYTIVSLFPNLERLMMKCWQDNPLKRPNGEDIAGMMQDASFTCLRNVLRFDMEEITCIHPGASEISYVDDEMELVAKDTDTNLEDHLKAGEDEKQKRCHSPRVRKQFNRNCERLWLWTGEGGSRRCTKIHIRFFNEGELYPKSIVGSRANCLVQVGLWELVGTKDNSIQLFGPPDVGPQHIVHQHDFQLDAEVVCLCYQPIKDKTIQGHLFAGLADGHLVIFNHAAPETNRTSVGSRSSTHEPCWFKTKTLTFENKRCSHLELVVEREELWIACGTKLRVLSTEIMLLDAAITVTSRAEHTILGLAHHHDNLFCIIDRSSRVLQYSMATRQLVQILQCGRFELEKGVSLIADEEEEVGEVEEVEEDSKSSPSSDSSEDKEMSFRDSYYSTPEQQMQPSSTLPAPPKRTITASCKHPGNSRDDAGLHRPFSEGSDRRRCSVSIPEVQAILTVKDTLWIGTTHGDIIIMCVDPNNRQGFKFGEVLAVMGLFLEKDDKKQPIKQLMRAGEEHVVAWQELKLSSPGSLVSDTREDKLHHYQLLVWQAWGSEDVGKFDHIHTMLNGAEQLSN
ncbi:leucine-rich repeat serine/threonine-protein kinase 1-like [Patiria miniata]|uniref:non-specific serine/threonine protein kinase n=1 Tax=Patiria miniata TaxID=46514 RepID=A0A914ATV5_PATMI|nr:leucine-rich repeat serine/threonine-protein kinase 1-like [Patiria miniata]